MIYLEYAAILAIVGFAVYYLSGMIKDLFKGKGNNNSCDKCNID